jgi:type I restriction enzyme R subunit
MATEAQARITINHLLEQAGWRFAPDGDTHPANIVCEHRVTKKLFIRGDELGKDFEHSPNGFVDYLLLNTDQRAIAVVEAKRESIEPLSAKEQARGYAESLGVQHVFLSNGLVHYYWNLQQGNPVKVSRFLPLEQLGKAAEWRPDSQRLAAVEVDENYIALSQDSAWLNYAPAERALVMVNKKIRLLRDYQLAAVRALQGAASPNNHRFLFEMATGTGKTLLSAAISKLYLRTDNASRILFLVDRLELETQAWKNLTAYLATDGIQTSIYKRHRNDWHSAQIVVTTIQSFAVQNRFQHEFAPTDFQLIISDEAHRTISGNNRAIFEYFVGAKLGLTATPRDYLKGLDEDAFHQNARDFERRLLLDTYRTFGCEDGTPTFRYTLMAAVGHEPPYLCNPVFLDARTKITTQMLSDEGYAVPIPATEDEEATEKVFQKKDFERTFFSDETSQSFVQCFFDNAKCDPITGEIGKAIVFAVSRRHATKLTKALNDEATRRLPSEYGVGSVFAVQVTSDVKGAQQMTIDFANNNLNGKSKWRASEFRDYDTSRSRVCVTVGMMTTGYDCEDILNVVLARPIFSPTDFIQIKGRGTRLYTFHFTDGTTERTEKKDNFALFDFFANCEYFEEDFDYDKKLELPKEPMGEPIEGGGGGTVRVDFTNTSPDPIANFTQAAIGLEGMRIDREMYRDRFAHEARAVVEGDAELREAMDREDWTTIESRIRGILFDRPQDSFSLPKLQELYKTDRLPSLREILARALGLITNIPTRGQLADEEFERFVATQDVNAVHSRELRTLFEAFLLDHQSRTLLSEGRFPELRAHDSNLYGTIAELPVTERTALMGYLRSQVPLQEFEEVK